MTESEHNCNELINCWPINEQHKKLARTMLEEGVRTEMIERMLQQILMKYGPII